VREASLQVDQGEILGVAGVEGSGSRELLYALAGRLRPESGELRLPDEIGFIPEDRQRDALLLDESVSDNVALRGAAARRGWFHRSTAEAMAERLVFRSGIRTADVRAPVSTLSGGNQQRLVLARELDGTPPLLVAVNPARGLDVAGSATIQQRMRETARAGTGVVYHTPDLDELIETSDRIVVVFEGRVTEVDVERDAVGRAMLGAS
jgi:simple sugar transport system ATP-binding protein